jgi:VanZ family protein
VRVFTEFFAAVPWFLPGLLVWGIVASALTPTVARALATRSAIVLAMLMSLGIVVLATLLPTSEALASADTRFEWCDLERLTLPPPSELLAATDTLRNVLLFIPLGMTLGLLTKTRRAAILIALAYALPFVIEAVQLLLSPLGRGCQSADVIDNALGLTLGLATALVLRWAGRWWSGRHHPGTTA